MGNTAMTTDFTKDLEIYSMLIDLVHSKLLIYCNPNREEDIDIKDLKILFDIGDKAIQNRLKQLIQLGKLDIDGLTEDSVNKITELLHQAKNMEEESY